jgi:hypothetical protein
VGEACSEIMPVLRQRDRIVEAAHPAVPLIVIRRALLAVVVARILRRKALAVRAQIVERLRVSIGTEKRKAALVADLRFDLQGTVCGIATVLHIGSGGKNRP